MKNFIIYFFQKENKQVKLIDQIMIYEREKTIKRSSWKSWKYKQII